MTAKLYELRLLFLRGSSVLEAMAAARAGLIEFRSAISFVILSEWSRENLRSPLHLDYLQAVGCEAYLRRIARVQRVILSIRQRR